MWPTRTLWLGPPLNETQFLVAVEAFHALYDLLYADIITYWIKTPGTEAAWDAATSHSSQDYQSLYAAANASAVATQYTAALTALNSTWPWYLEVLSSHAPYGFFSGSMDEIQLLNTTLSAAQVLTLMTTPTQALTCSGLTPVAVGVLQLRWPVPLIGECANAPLVRSVGGDSEFFGCSSSGLSGFQLCIDALRGSATE